MPLKAAIKNIKYLSGPNGGVYTTFSFLKWRELKLRIGFKSDRRAKKQGRTVSQSRDQQQKEPIPAAKQEKVLRLESSGQAYQGVAGTVVDLSNRNWSCEGDREEITVALLFFLPSNLPPLLPINPNKHEAADMEVWKAQLIYVGLQLLSGAPTSATLASRFY